MNATSGAAVGRVFDFDLQPDEHRVPKTSPIVNKLVHLLRNIGEVVFLIVLQCSFNTFLMRIVFTVLRTDPFDGM